MPNFLTSQTEPDEEEDTVNPRSPKFKIFTGTMKAFEKEENGVSRKYLSCTASSTIEDLHGDYMTDECVMDMAPQAAAKGMTIFLNHSYKWPEDVAGKTVGARVVQRGHDDTGKPIYDLDLEIQLNESNERAVASYTAIKDQGIKAGISIGAMIDQWAFRDEDKGFWGGLEIKKVDLLEASIVGIPANQRSWVVNALGALGAPKPIIAKALGRETTMNTELDIEEKSVDAAEPDDDVRDATEAAEAVTTKEVEAEVAPEEETPAPDDEVSEEATAEKSVAPLDEASAALDSMKAAGADAGLLEIVLGFLEGATEEVASLRKANEALTTERDQLLSDVKAAAEIVETIAHTPIGRKAQFTGPVSDFRQKYGGYYDEATVRFLEGVDANE